MQIRRLFTLTVATLGVVAPAAAQWSDNFDSYATNSTLIGQGGWEGWDGNGAANATVVNTVSTSSPNSVRITGTSDMVHTFSGYTSGKWIFRTMHYVASTSVGDNYFILMNQYESGNHQNEDWSVQLQARASANTMRSIEANTTLPLVEDAWTEIRCEIDLDGNTVSIFYNNALLATHPWRSALGISEIQCVDLYSDNTASLAYFDDIRLERASAPIVVLPASYSITRGIEVGSNDVNKIRTDDDVNASAEQRFQFAPTLPNTQLVAQLTNIPGNLTSATLKVRLSANSLPFSDNSCRQEIALRDVNTNALVVVDSRKPTSTESEITVNLDAAQRARFIRGDGSMDVAASVYHLQPLSPAWRMNVDIISLTVTQ